MLSVPELTPAASYESKCKALYPADYSRRQDGACPRIVVILALCKMCLGNL
jgi:hypothetical protein